MKVRSEDYSLNLNKVISQNVFYFWPIKFPLSFFFIFFYIVVCF